ncbi:MAG: hypothetical protein Kow0031_00420 [Anaerolineae bacterium]
MTNLFDSANTKLRPLPFSVLMLLLFALLSILVTWPIAFRPDDFTVLNLYTDDLLEAWTLRWNTHALLGGPDLLRHFWDANIFYPYPNTLAFTEHLLGLSLLLQPVILLADSPLVGTNLGILLTTTLTGWGTYLLVTWLTGNRAAGFVAGVAFAFTPFRLGHITQLHLMSTHWLPFIFLAMARLIRFNRNRDLLLLTLFANLQFYSAINYAPLVALAAAIWALGWLIYYRARLKPSLFGRLGLFALVTLLLNWPVLRLYQQISEQMGVVRTLGDARLYGAWLTNYILPMGNSLLYGRWLGLPTHTDYMFPGIGIFISTFPGVLTLLLALTAIIAALRGQLPRAWRVAALSLLLLGLVGFVLSFGANDQAFGAAAAPVAARLLPYPLLYEWLPLLQGLRVPLRFALLPLFALALLSGIGFAWLAGRVAPLRRHPAIFAAVIAGLMLLEHLPAPLPGVAVPPPPPVSAWLAANTPADAVVMELPFVLHTPDSRIDLLREYHSTVHWRRLVNGASGFEPLYLEELGHLFDAFPNWQAFDAARRLGVQLLVLHQNQFDAADWDNILSLLPAYWPAVSAVTTLPNALVLQLAPPACQPAAIQVDAAGWPSVTFANPGFATWVANPRQPSNFTANGDSGQFLEPLFVLPGDVATVELPAPATTDWLVELANAGLALTPHSPPPAKQPAGELNWQPVELRFVNGAVLQAMALGQNPQPCSLFEVHLQWLFEAYAGETVQVELVDRFGRTALSQAVTPASGETPTELALRLPLAETLPAGAYQLRVRLLSADGADVPAIGLEGVPITEPLALPLTLRPASAPPPLPVNEPVALVNNARFLGINPLPAAIAPGDWLRFALHWQAAEAVTGDFTVFTQLIGPDGQVWAQHDNPPRGGWYPTGLWQPGETVSDDYALRLDPAAPPGDYRLFVGMYDAASGARVPVSSGGDFIEAGKVAVQP